MSNALRRGTILILLSAVTFGVAVLVARTAQSVAEDGPADHALFEADDNARASVATWPIVESVRRTGDLDRLGVDLSQAKLVFSNSVRSVAAVPSHDGGCLIVRSSVGPGGGMSCATEGTDGTTASVGYDGAVGLVPDSVREVTFTKTDGTRAVMPVRGNVWEAGHDVATVEFVVNGHLRKDELMPRISLPEGAKICANGLVTSSDASCDVGQ